MTSPNLKKNINKKISETFDIEFLNKNSLKGSIKFFLEAVWLLVDGIIKIIKNIKKKKKTDIIRNTFS